MIGDSFILNGGGGGESTSNSGESEQDLVGDLDLDELRDGDFVHESLQLDSTSECGVTFPFVSWLR